jgi:NADPH:quinone reductase-like Zn-dependent oxidoreductase
VAGEWVLVTAVGSGVGTAALQLIHARGGRCIGTSRTQEKLDRAAELGLDVGVNTGSDDLVAVVKKHTGGGVNAVVDLVAGKTFPESLKTLASRGRVIVVGLTAGRSAELDLGLLLRKRLRITGTVLRSRSTEEKSALVSSYLAVVAPLLEAGKVHAVLDRTFTFDEVRASHEYVESNANFGKVVVSV